jgi:acetolactate synthase-1/2/3 large subunit
MKVSDYVAQFLVDQGIKHVFVVTGGAVAHLIDSIAKNPDIEYVCSQHEQAAAFAVDGYARVSGGMGAAIVTTGPGVTNLMTGVAGMYYDSIPSIFIGGQVSTARQSKNAPGVRQLGFQEAPHVELMNPITKYAVTVERAEDIRYALEKAVYMAKEGRPGPVFVDICDDVQRMEVRPEELEGFRNYMVRPGRVGWQSLSNDIDQMLDMIAEAERPVLVLGAGIKIAKVEERAKDFVGTFGMPIGLTWAIMDMYPSDHYLNIGGFGISVPRAGNFAVQNADLILSIGSRLDSHATGPLGTFAPKAKKIIVDIDTSELSKFGKQGMLVDLLIHADLWNFFDVFESRVAGINLKDIYPWFRQIALWKAKYPICPPEYDDQKEGINPYVFLRELSKATKEDDIIIPDCGANLIQTFQGYSIKEGQRVFSSFNNSPMGYSLAASIGACFANDKQPVICIIGDGGLQVNIQELATIVRYNLPIKIFVFNNHGYGIIQQTQDDWLEGRYEASTPDSGLADPDYVKIAMAYGIHIWRFSSHYSLLPCIESVLAEDWATLCPIEIAPGQRIIPMLKAGNSLENMHPLLDPEELKENMLVEGPALLELITSGGIILASLTRDTCMVVEGRHSCDGSTHSPVQPVSGNGQGEAEVVHAVRSNLSKMCFDSEAHIS